MSELLEGGLTSFRQFFYLSCPHPALSRFAGEGNGEREKISCPHPALSRKAGEGNGEREKIQNLFIAFF